MEPAITPSAQPIYEYTDHQRQMWRIHDARRTAVLSNRYYANKAKKIALISNWLNISGAAGGSAALLQPLAAFIPQVLAPLGILLAISAAAAPLLGLGEQLCRTQLLRDGWQWHAANLEHLVESISLRGSILDSDVLTFQSQLAHARHLAAIDESSPDQPLVDRLTAEIERQFPATSLWMPAS